MRPTLTLIVNPAAKKASNHKIQKAFNLLESAGYDIGFFSTEKKGDAEHISRKASEAGEKLIIAAGGDGTFNEAANGLAHTQSGMAIIPMGTTNVLAKELGIPEDVEGAVRRALSGSEHNVSLGKISFTHNSSFITRYFLLMAGIGFDGDAVYYVNNPIKKFSGKSSYIFSGLKALFKYSPDLLSIAADGNRYSAYSAIIGNASKYGGNLTVTPDADLFKPELLAFIMKGGRRADILRYACGILSNTHTRFKDTAYIKARVIEVAGNARIQIDGDYVGSTPAKITVAPDALRLVF